MLAKKQNPFSYKEKKIQNLHVDEAKSSSLRGSSKIQTHRRETRLASIFLLATRLNQAEITLEKACLHNKYIRSRQKISTLLSESVLNNSERIIKFLATY